MSNIALFWFRRDLRLQDNAGLYHALKGEHSVLPLFIYDTDILDALEDKKDARVAFIYDTITDLHQVLHKQNSSIILRYGKPMAIFQQLLKEYKIAAVYTNHDYEPYATERDTAIRDLLQSQNIPFQTYKDHVIFEKDEVLKSDGKPYTVFTPYSRAWRNKLNDRMVDITKKDGQSERISFYFQSYPTEQYLDHLYKTKPLPEITLESMGFERTAIPIPPKKWRDLSFEVMIKRAIFPASMARRVSVFTFVLARSVFGRKHNTHSR